MNTSDLVRIVGKRCKDLFLGVFAKDRLPTRLPAKRPLLLICNFDPAHSPGSHWIAMHVDERGRGEYFDSFGRKPEDTFKTFLEKNCSSWIFNDKQLQSVISTFCGYYCVFYCLFKKLDYDLLDIVNCFTTDTALNDVMVHKFVCEHFN